MKLLVGLGNPGPAYGGTRHNVGFQVVNTIAKNRGVKSERSLHRALVATVDLGGEQVLLAKPLTYMNRSGEAVAPLLAYYRLSLADLLVIYDDVALPLGKLRLRSRGSAGGHNGLRSIISSLGTTEFSRLRLGIDSPPSAVDLPTYVLDKFLPEEAGMVADMVERAAEAVELFVTSGLLAAMNQINSPLGQ